MKLSVVILNWNRKGDTKECVDSLLKSNLKKDEIEIIVVDNGSTDGSEEELKKIKTNGFSYEVIPTGKNLGFAAGNNVGIKHALNHDSKYIFILNNDTVVHEDLIENLLKASLEHPQAGILTPKIYFAKGFEFHKTYKKSELGRVIWSFGGNIDWQNMYAQNKHVDDVDSGQLNKNFETDFATGAAMFVKADVLKMHGGFDENYYLYMEDVDFCERYTRSGGKILAVSDAIVWHKVSQSSGIGSDLNDYFITRNRLYFAQKFAPLRTKVALLRESIKFIFCGRPWQRRGVVDYLTGNLKIGSWKASVRENENGK